MSTETNNTSNARPMPRDWASITNPLRLLLIGAGGNGAEFHEGLSRLHHGLKAIGGAGLDVTVIDDDEVSESNVVRQRFWPHDVGANKAITLVHRTNNMMGTSWKAAPIRYTGEKLAGKFDLVVTAVDNKAARNALQVENKGLMWLDMGCDRDKGQVVLGRIGDNTLTSEWPSTLAHFPDMADPNEVNVPSCSAADSLARQDLMVNTMVATHAINMLWKAFRANQFIHNGVMIDLAQGFSQAIPFMPTQHKQ